jgi:hypothetical protein
MADNHMIKFIAENPGPQFKGSLGEKKGMIHERQ